MTSRFSTTAASEAFESGTTRAAQPLLLRGRDGHRRRHLGGPRAALERQFAHHPILFKAIGRQLSAAGQYTKRDGKVEGSGLSRELGRGQVDDNSVERTLIARVDHGPLDAVRALFDGCLGPSHENGLGSGSGRERQLRRPPISLQCPTTRTYAIWPTWNCPHAGPRFLLSVASALCLHLPCPASPRSHALRGGYDTHMSLRQLSIRIVSPGMIRRVGIGQDRSRASDQICCVSARIQTPRNAPFRSSYSRLVVRGNENAYKYRIAYTPVTWC